jgi:hypothetical protein
MFIGLRQLDTSDGLIYLELESTPHSYKHQQPRMQVRWQAQLPEVDLCVGPITIHLIYPTQIACFFQAQYKP